MRWIIVALVITMIVSYSSVTNVYARETNFQVHYKLPTTGKANIEVTLNNLNNGDMKSSGKFKGEEYSYANFNMDTGPYKQEVKICIENFDLYKHKGTSAEAKKCKNLITENWVEKINMNVPCYASKSNYDICKRYVDNGPLPAENNNGWGTPDCGDIIAGCTLDIPNPGDIFRGLFG